MEKEEKKQGKGFWNATRILIVLFLVIGLFIGAIVEHFFVEPSFNEGIRTSLEQKTIECRELEGEYAQCIREKSALEKAQT